jgi:hypothetical protein
MVEPAAAAADPATHQALEQQLAAALRALSVRNDDVVRSCNSAFDEVRVRLGLYCLSGGASSSQLSWPAVLHCPIIMAAELTTCMTYRVLG